jgi:hypothetical protein
MQMNKRKSMNTGMTVLMAIFIVVPGEIAAEDTDLSRQTRIPNVVVSGGLGLSDHFGKTNEIDAVSGATSLLSGEKKSDVGVALGAIVDGEFVRLGPGNLGLMTGFWINVPHRYYDIVLIPRYRLQLLTKGQRVPRVEPWMGFLATLTFEERFSKAPYFAFGISLGCDVVLGHSLWILGTGLHVNMVNPVPVNETVTISGTPHDVEHRLDSVFLVLQLGRRVRQAER